ncbi:MAG: hypothetical protein IJZ37_00400 [Clostridia bacterium]|nr:hypothetical protein [Clostridia bacterium]
MKTSKKIAGNLALLLGVCLLCTACRNTPLLKPQQQGTLLPSSTPEASVSAEQVIEDIVLTTKTPDSFCNLQYLLEEHGPALVSAEKLKQLYVYGGPPEEYPQYETLIPTAMVEFVSQREIPLEKQLSMPITSEEDRLIYKKTVLSPFGSTSYQYVLNNESEKIVLLTDKGELKRISYKFAWIEVSQAATPEEVASVLYLFLQKWVDVSSYQYVNVFSVSHPDYGFGDYHFEFYNVIDGVLYDQAEVTVYDDGTVGYLAITKGEASVENLQIDHSKARTLVAAKLQDLYSACDIEGKTLVSYKDYVIPQIVWCKGEWCVNYTVAPEYRAGAQSEVKTDYGMCVYIPLRLLVDEKK